MSDQDLFSQLDPRFKRMRRDSTQDTEDESSTPILTVDELLTRDVGNLDKKIKNICSLFKITLQKDKNDKLFYKCPKCNAAYHLDSVNFMNFNVCSKGCFKDIRPYLYRFIINNELYLTYEEKKELESNHELHPSSFLRTYCRFGHLNLISILTIRDKGKIHDCQKCLSNPSTDTTPVIIPLCEDIEFSKSLGADDPRFLRSAYLKQRINEHDSFKNKTEKRNPSKFCTITLNE